MAGFTLLTKKQIDPDTGIDVIKKVGLKCAVSDFAILLGASAIDEYHVDDDSSLKGRAVWWYLSSGIDWDVAVVSKLGKIIWCNAGRRCGGVRPVIPFSNIVDITSNGVKGKNGLLEVEYGEYPQYAVDSSLGKILDDEFLAGRLKRTGKIYTTDSRRWNAFSKKFKATEHEEFEYNGKRYVRVKSNCYARDYILSNGVKVKQNEYVWVEVSPIKWLVDEKSGLMLSKICLASGIRFCKNECYYGNFETTEMYMFLNKYFAEDIIPSKLQEAEEEEIKTDNQAKSKLESTIEEIYELCNNMLNGEEITKKVENLVQEYNIKLSEIKEKRKNNIPSLETPASVANLLELNLSMILDDLKKYSDKYKEYFEMMDIIDKSIAIVNGEKQEDDSEIGKDLKTILSICIPFLKEADAQRLKNELLLMFNNMKLEMMNYISNSDNSKLTYTNIAEMNLEIRRKLQPILEKLNTNVKKRDIELEVQKAVNDILEGNRMDAKNKYLSFYLQVINNTYNDIMHLIQKLPQDLKEEYHKEVNTIMDSHIDYNKEFNDVTKDLTKMWLSLNKVLFKIEKYLGELTEVKTSYIDMSKFKK